MLNPPSHLTAIDAGKSLRYYADVEKAKFLQIFFKTGIGKYAEGDLFLGVTVPDTPKVARIYAALSLVEVRKLLISKFHEDRLLALILLVN